jgi:hypothetical protein
MALKNLQVNDATGALSLATPAATGVITKTGVAGIIGTIPNGTLVTLGAGGATVADNNTAKADAYVYDEPNGTVAFNGIIAGVLGGATAGNEYFLGAAGVAATTSGGGTVIQSVGYAVGATDLLFVPGIPPL